MAVVLRLRRQGAKKRPYYKVVAADKRSPRDGKFIEILGNYDPMKEGMNANLDLERVDYWLGVGAAPSMTVRTLIRKVREAGPETADAETAESATA